MVIAISRCCVTHSWHCLLTGTSIFFCNVLNQKSCVALVRDRARLFGGAGDVPDVHGLQAWIEKAWRAGFDTEVRMPHLSQCAAVLIIRNTGKFSVRRNTAGYQHLDRSHRL